MNKLRALNDKTFLAIKNGHSGLFTTHDLALMLSTPVTDTFRKYLYKAVKKGVLARVATNIYVNANASPTSTGVLEKIALLLRWNEFIYISLETQLSFLGVISQVTMGYTTLMTTGRSGKFKTPYGVIEFTHTNRSLDELEKGVYFDSETGIYRATEKRATADLHRVGRNIHMLEG